ncbi:hypothetical protein CDD83_8265 [Cordyceps sp. RAO-2017]|nr:hypothetical protein CDD83_8265 [Cordyceps sp. RAO-2017]
MLLHMIWEGQTLSIQVRDLKRKRTAPNSKLPLLHQPEPAQVQAISTPSQIRLGRYRLPSFLLRPVGDGMILWQQAWRPVEKSPRQGVGADVRLVDGTGHSFDIYSRRDEDWDVVRVNTDEHTLLSLHTPPHVV